MKISFAPALLGLLFVWSPLACRTPNHGAASAVKDAENSPAAVAVDDQVAANFIAESVGRLAELNAFYVALGKGDADNPALLPSVVDEAAKTISFDFAPFATSFPEPNGAATLSKLMTFPLPDDLPAGAKRNLSDPVFAEKFVASLAKFYGASGGSEAEIEGGSTPYADVFDECAKHHFGSNTTITTAVPSGSDFNVKFDCKRLLKQAKSGLTLTAFEVDTIGTYTGSFFDKTAHLLRNRRFKLPVEDVTGAISAKKMAVEGFLSLVIISGLNKIDPVAEHVFRGMSGFFGSCEPDATAPEKGSTPAEAAAKFCAFLDTHPSFRECSFQSTSRLGNIALTFNGVFADVQDQEFGEEGPSFANLPLHQDGKLPLVAEISTTSGLYVAQWSTLADEQEVLIKPGIHYAISKAKSGVALQPANPGEFTDYKKFQFVPCGASLNAEQTARISHLRLSLQQQ